MENNSFINQQNYQQPYAQPQQTYAPVDPNYENNSQSFLSSSIAHACTCWLPIGSIIVLIKIGKNRKRIREYLASGFPETPKIKTASIIETVAKVHAILFTILWGVYICMAIFGIVATIISEL